MLRGLRYGKYGNVKQPPNGSNTVLGECTNLYGELEKKVSIGGGKMMPVRKMLYKGYDPPLSYSYMEERVLIDR